MRVAAPAIAALLVEAALYLMPGVAEFRDRLQAVGNPFRQGAWLFTAALLPYLIYSLGAGCFDIRGLALLCLIAGTFAFWYVVFPWRRLPMAADLLLLTAVCAAMLSDAFKFIYPQLAPKAAVNILGQLMLIRTYAFALFSIRGHELVGFGFWPNRDDWRVGIREFLCFIPVGFVLSWLTGFASGFRPFEPKLLAAFVGTFLGILWVVALSEELFFRGVLLRWLEKVLASPLVALAVTSVLFGMVHLPFRAFPNWKFMILAGAAGVFYGRGFQATGRIRTGMVTHALVASIWRVFLT